MPPTTLQEEAGVASPPALEARQEQAAASNATPADQHNPCDAAQAAPASPTTIADVATPRLRPRRRPATFNVLSVEEALSVLELTSEASQAEVTDAVTEAYLECHKLDVLEPRRRQLSGAIFSVATESLCANDASCENWVLAAEAQHYLGRLNLSPLLEQCPPLTQIGRSPYHFDLIGTVETAREILGVSEDASVAAVRSAFKESGALNTSSTTRHRPVGAFIALCLASSNGLQPRDCYPFLSIEASTYMRMFNWEIGDCSLHSVFDEMLGQSSAESSFDALKNRSKAATKAAAAEDKLRKDLATSKKDLTLARKELVGARSSAESLRQRLTKAEGSSTKVHPSAQELLKRVEKERDEAVEQARVADQGTAASAEEHEKRSRALQNKVVEMAEIGRRSRLKYDEEELKRLNQIKEHQDEISALKREVDEPRRTASTSLSSPTAAPPPFQAPQRLPPPPPATSITARLVAQVRELSEQLAQKTEENTELLLLLAEG